MKGAGDLLCGPMLSTLLTLKRWPEGLRPTVDWIDADAPTSGPKVPGEP